jgi:exodeoxyribonuclease VII large subunit
VVSAVGHEVDFTICDFVADLRAATPSAAAELTLPDKGDLSRRVAALSTRLSGAQTTRLRRYRTRLTQLASAKVLTSPEGVYRLRRESLEGLS